MKTNDVPFETARLVCALEHLFDILRYINTVFIIIIIDEASIFGYLAVTDAA